MFIRGFGTMYFRLNTTFFGEYMSRVNNNFRSTADEIANSIMDQVHRSSGETFDPHYAQNKRIVQIAGRMIGTLAGICLIIAATFTISTITTGAAVPLIITGIFAFVVCNATMVNINLYDISKYHIPFLKYDGVKYTNDLDTKKCKEKLSKNTIGFGLVINFTVDQMGKAMKRV
jgi:hypothetical protein